MFSQNRFISMSASGRKRLRNKPRYETTFLYGLNDPSTAFSSGGVSVPEFVPESQFQEMPISGLTSLCFLLHLMCILQHRLCNHSIRTILGSIRHTPKMLPRLLTSCSTCRRTSSGFDGATGCSVCQVYGRGPAPNSWLQRFNHHRPPNTFW